MRGKCKLVPLAGIEPALLSEPDFESGASTSSAKGAFDLYCEADRAKYTNPEASVNRVLIAIMEKTHVTQ